jgi:hypothetical protein
LINQLDKISILEVKSEFDTIKQCEDQLKSLTRKLLYIIQLSNNKFLNKKNEEGMLHKMG